MLFDPDIHHRRSIRLSGYDYSQQGAYFVTVCVQNRECLLGNVVDGKMVLNEAGIIVQSTWDGLPQRFPNVTLDEFIIMPNHVHGIIFICGRGESCIRPKQIVPIVGDHKDRPYRPNGTRAHSIGRIIQTFKSLTTQKYTIGVKQSGWFPFPGRLWQRNYYEHIIRDEDDLSGIRQYIADNPVRWDEDENNTLFFAFRKGA